MRSNTYDSVNDLWLDAINCIEKDGEVVQSRIGSSRELVGWSGTIENASQSFLTAGLRLSPEYAAGELAWYLSGQRSARALFAYAPKYADFCDEAGVAWGAYGHRLSADANFLINKVAANKSSVYNQKQIDHGAPLFNRSRSVDPYHSQLRCAIEALRSAETSRQVVLTLYNAGDLVWAHAGGKKDIPCTLSIQFLIRNNQLHTIVTMRSNDIFLGMPYDIFCFTAIARLVASELNCQMGSYTHQVGSLHLYSKDRDKLNRAAYSGPVGGWDDVARLNMFTEVGRFLSIERMLRRQSEIDDPSKVVDWYQPENIIREIDYNINDPMLYDLLMVVGAKFVPTAADQLIKKIRSETVKRYVMAWRNR